MPNKYPYIVKQTQEITQLKTTYHLVFAESDEDAEEAVSAGKSSKQYSSAKTLSIAPSQIQTLTSDSQDWELHPELNTL